MPNDDKSKIMTRVEFTFADGHQEILEGEDAQKWEESVSAVLVTHQVRGYAIPGLAALKWINVPKKERTNVGD